MNDKCFHNSLLRTNFKLGVQNGYVAYAYLIHLGYVLNSKHLGCNLENNKRIQSHCIHMIEGCD